MEVSSPPKVIRFLVLWALVICGLAAIKTPLASGSERHHSVKNQLSLGIMLGTTWPDPDLADFRWDVRGQISGGAEVALVQGGSSIALRATRWGSQQSTGLLGVSTAPDVTLTTIGLGARTQLIRVMGVAVSGSLGLGRVHLGYSPDHLTLDTGGATGPVEVVFRPADEWIGSLGVVLGRPLTPRLGLGLEVEHSLFSLNTIHTNGGVVQEDRRAFGSWNIRFHMNWILRNL